MSETIKLTCEQDGGAYALYVEKCISQKAILKWAKKFSVDLSSGKTLKNLLRDKDFIVKVLDDLPPEGDFDKLN